MLNGLIIMSIFNTVKDFIKEVIEQPAAPGTHFDDEAYKADIMNPDISMMDIVEKRRKNMYTTTRPESKKGVPYFYYAEEFNQAEYDRVRMKCGVETAEKLKAEGHFRYTKKIGYSYL